jgi:hypothetical protein
MKTITFDYTKKDGSTSARTLLALVTPGDKYAGIDLSELDPIVAANFAHDAEELHEKYILDMQALQTKFDLKFAYKQFLASGATNVIQV